MRRSRACAVVILLAILGASGPGLRGQPIVLELGDESSFSGCTGNGVSARGTLSFSLVASSDLFSEYGVVAELATGMGPLLGTGTYRVGTAESAQHEMSLDLSLDDDAPRQYVSGSVSGGERFPRGMVMDLSAEDAGCEFAPRLHVVIGPILNGFLRGDCNTDGSTDLSDAVKSLVLLFGEAGEPRCHDACDTNDDGEWDLTDAVSLLDSIFTGGEPPPPPIDVCGLDPTDEDDLGCRDYYGPCYVHCDSQVSAIAEEIPLEGSCSVVIRIASGRLAAWQILCGEYADVTESSARSSTQGTTGGGGGGMLNPVDPPDAYVFYSAPLDFGGVAVVSARTGLGLFGAGIVWVGEGSIHYPREWRAPKSLEENCFPFEGDIPWRSYNLITESGPPASTIEAFLDIVRRTPLPEALETRGELLDAVVLFYSPGIPGDWEIIVILNGGSPR